ncbi:MAG: ATP-binding protein, partial [Caldisericaceae bacterium]
MENKKLVNNPHDSEIAGLKREERAKIGGKNEEKLLELLDKFVRFYENRNAVWNGQIDSLAARFGEYVLLAERQARNLASASAAYSDKYAWLVNLSPNKNELETFAKDNLPGLVRKAHEKKCRNADMTDINSVIYVDEDPGYIRPEGSKREKDFNFLLMLAQTKGKSIAGGHGDVLIVGDTGTGKTMSVKQLVYELSKDSQSGNGTSLLLPNIHSLHIPLIRVQCTGEDGKNLIATTGFINNTTVVKEGPIPKAIKAANDNMFAILLLDEISALPPDSQKALNEFLETGSASYQDIRWYLNPNATLFIVATTNDPDKPGYGGTNTINTDL